MEIRIGKWAWEKEPGFKLEIQEEVFNSSLKIPTRGPVLVKWRKGSKPGSNLPLPSKKKGGTIKTL